MIRQSHFEDIFVTYYLILRKSKSHISITETHQTQITVCEKPNPIRLLLFKGKSLKIYNCPDYPPQ